MKRGHLLGPLCAGIVLAAALPAAAWAQDGAAARSLAATCFTCHGTDGRSVGGVPPSIAGLDRGYLLQQMREFREGTRPATIMHQHARGYTDEQLQLIATYFSNIVPGPATPAPAAAPAAGRGY